MNLKSLIIATLITYESHAAGVLPSDIDPILRSSDFTHAEEVTKQGTSILRLNLTQTGIDKIEILKKVQVKEKLTMEVKGKFYAFKLRESIVGDQIDIGPFSPKIAHKIAEELST